MRIRRSFAARFFALLLVCAPRDFRREYDRPMWRDVAENLAEEQLLHGPFAASLYYFGACCDLIACGLRERAAMIVRDLVFALRALRKTPLFTLIVIATLALAIGANAAVFSVLRAVVLAPLPYAQPQELVALFSWSPGDHEPTLSSSLPDALDVRGQNRTLAELAALQRSGATLTGIGKPQALTGFAVTWPAFAVLGVQPELGRFFDAADDPAGAGVPIVVSDELWRTRLGADVDALGRAITLDARTYRVIGVTPPGFAFPLPNTNALTAADFWTIQRRTDASSAGAQLALDRGERRFSVIARLRPGVSLDAADADVARVGLELQRRYPTTNFKYGFRLKSFSEVFIGPIRPILIAAYGAVIGVLLIACANVANLLLSRSAARDRELAIRFAIGATRARIVAQILTETLLFAAVSGILGVVIAAWLVRGFVALDPPSVPRLGDIHLDAAVAAYTFGIVVVCALASGIVPALALSAPHAANALKAAGRGGDMNRGARARNVFVVAEIAIGVALVITSGLIVRSFATLAHTPLGITIDDIRVAKLSGLPQARYRTSTQVAAFERAAAARVAALPGVVDAAWLSATSPVMGSHTSSGTKLEDLPRPEGQEISFDLSVVGPRYFALSGVPLRGGRTFTDDDRLGTAQVAIVNAAFADKYYHGHALGKWIAPGLSVTQAMVHRTIVGVVGNVRRTYTTPYEPAIYVPIAQIPQPQASLLVRVRPGVNVDAAIGAAVVAGDPLLAAPPVRALRSYADEELARTRLSALLLGSLALVALFLAVAGVYAVVSFGVAQRTHEFGIRMALGSRPFAIVVNVIVRSARLATIGILGGVLLAGVAARFVAGQLVGVGTLDPLTYAAVVAIVAVAALLAALVPAVRATRVDPIVALRYQ